MTRINTEDIYLNTNALSDGTGSIDDPKKFFSTALTALLSLNGGNLYIAQDSGAVSVATNFLINKPVNIKF